MQIRRGFALLLGGEVKCLSFGGHIVGLILFIDSKKTERGSIY